MHMHVWVVVGMMLAAVYVVPIAIGLCISSLRTAVMLAVASFGGLYATVWSALRPLLAPLASMATQTELFTVVRSGRAIAPMTSRWKHPQSSKHTRPSDARETVMTRGGHP
jgi:hypothetical protein